MKKEHYEKIIEELIKLIDEGVYIGVHGKG